MAEIHSVVAEKRKAHPSLYKTVKTVKGNKRAVPDETGFYNAACRTLLKYVIRRPIYCEASCLVIIMSALFTKEKQSRIVGALKTAIKGQTAKPFHIYFRANKADINCQIADYCGWAITIAWERKEMRALKAIDAMVKSQFDLFRHGSTFFY